MERALTETAMKLNLSHGLLMDNLLGHIKEVKPVSQRAGPAGGQAPSVCVPSIWAGSLLRARLGSSPVCELEQISAFQMDYNPKHWL